MYAVVVSGGKQYKVNVGDIVEVEKLDLAVGEKLKLQVLMSVEGEAVSTGKDVKAVEAEVLSHNKAKKVVVFKYKPKKNQRKKQGHRQPFTRIKIVSIG